MLMSENRRVYGTCVRVVCRGIGNGVREVTWRIVGVMSMGNVPFCVATMVLLYIKRTDI